MRMKNTLRKLILGLLFMVFISLEAFSQDVLILKNGDKIDCVIIEIFEDRVSYLEFNDDSEILYTISRAKLHSIRLSNGKVIRDIAPTLEDNLFFEDRKRNIKFNFFSMTADVVIFTYEQAIGPYTSFEITPKVFGYGPDQRSIKGFGLDAAYKMKISAILNKSDLPVHLLHGGYGRLSGGMAYTEESKFSFLSLSGYRNKQTVIHLGIDFGKQWIVRNIVSLDLMFGLHYYYDFFESTATGNVFSSHKDFNHGDLHGSDNFAAQIGFNIGILFDRVGKTKRKNR